MNSNIPACTNKGKKKIKPQIETYIWNQNGLGLEYSLWTTHKSATDAELSLGLLS